MAKQCKLAHIVSSPSTKCTLAMPFHCCMDVMFINIVESKILLVEELQGIFSHILHVIRNTYSKCSFKSSFTNGSFLRIFKAIVTLHI